MPDTNPDFINNTLKTLKTQYNIKKHKLFHFNNLVLFIQHDLEFDIYIVSIYQINTQQTYSPFGMHCTLQDAINKFDQIAL